MSLCQGISAPPGSFLGFTTSLVGIYPGGASSTPLFQWNWTDTFNGTSGGIGVVSNDFPVDPGSGNGGITITGLNGIPLNPLPLSQVEVTASGLTYSRVSQTFNGTVTLKNVGSTPITGPLEIVILSLTSGVTLTNPAGVFAGNPYIAAPQISTLAPGQACGFRTKWGSDFDGKWGAISTQVGRGFDGKWGSFGPRS